MKPAFPTCPGNVRPSASHRDLVDVNDSHPGFPWFSSARRALPAYGVSVGTAIHPWPTASSVRLIPRQRQPHRDRSGHEAVASLRELQYSRRKRTGCRFPPKEQSRCVSAIQRAFAGVGPPGRAGGNEEPRRCRAPPQRGRERLGVCTDDLGYRRRTLRTHTG